MNDEIDLCCVCGFPGNVVPLHRITFVDDPRGRLIEPGPAGPPSFLLMVAVLAKTPKHNDSIICADCIRAIKRIPLTDLETYADH